MTPLPIPGENPITKVSTIKEGQRDTAADWKAFRAAAIPTKGGTIDKLPRLFLDTLAGLEGTQERVCTQEEEQRPRLSILELGCGCGELSVSLHCRGHDVFGVDVNREAIETARRKAPGIANSTNTRIAFRVSDIAREPGTTVCEAQEDYDLCVMQLLLSIVGTKDQRKNALRVAHGALFSKKGILYLSCSGVSDEINPNYKRLYEEDASALSEDYGLHSYYSRDSENNNILYATHHFTKEELESLLSEEGFGDIHIERHTETSSRRPDEAAYFLYATARCL